MLDRREEAAHVQALNALRSQLSWTHFRELIAIDDPLKRSFYVQMCRLERWSTTTFKTKLNGLLSERTAIAKRPEVVARQALADLDGQGMSPDLVFRDPYLSDFLGRSASPPI
ncbi:MAG: putative nuclease of restriction endonuclease-like (RecB) superfamily [Bradymonadia bacterium]|jgi:predicted nuclease of restriction endonuclease-like (RecB) superfamily